MKKRLLSLTLVLLLTLTLIPCDALAAEPASGACGENLTWTLADGKLTISGSGDMTDYSEEDGAPWSDYYSDISSVVISKGVTSIGKYAFYFCSALSFELPEGLERIGSNAFSESCIAELIVPASVNEISDSSFNGCYNLADISVADENSNFASFNGALYSKSPNELLLYPLGKEDENYIVQNGTNSIGPRAFFGNGSLKNVSIPDSVSSIGIGAFSSCSALQKAELPQGITELPDDLFSNCDMLSDADIPQNVTKIGARAFKNCNKLENAIIPDGIKSIGDEAFFSCFLISELSLPNGIEHIGKDAFKGTRIASVSFDGTKEQWLAIGGADSGLDDADINYLRHTHEFGDSWYSNENEHWHECSTCGEVTDKTLHTDNGGDTCPICGAKLSAVLASGSEKSYIWSLSRSGVLTVSGSALPDFVGDGSSIPWRDHSGRILSVAIESGVTSVGSGAFRGCEKLTQIIIPDTVEVLDLNALIGCTSFERYDVADGNKAYASIDGVLFNADKTQLISYPFGKTGSYTVPDAVTSIAKVAFASSCIERIVLPDSVTQIGESAFSNCSKLKSIMLPKGITSLPDSLFSGCTVLEEIGIPESVKALGKAVFSGCSALKEVTIPSPVVVIPDEAFSGCVMLEKITIPAGVAAIGENAFKDCTALKTVNFLGNDKQWDAINIKGSNEAINSADKTFAGHTHSYCDTVIEPTCTERGYTLHKCSCGDEKQDSYKEPLGHSYKNGVCIRCGILSAQHDHDFKPLITEPTCTSEGFTTYICSCGENYTKDYVSALEHKTELRNAKAATCLNGGYTGDEVCTVCEKIFKAGSEISALGHETELRGKKAATCTETGYSGDTVCTRCGDIIKPGNNIGSLGHKFAGGKCSVCGANDPDYKPSAVTPSFEDVKPGTFYYEAVQWAVENGITAGTGATTFSPNSGCSRYQIVVFLWRTAGCPAAKAEVNFTDVAPADSFYEAVQWAVECGITKGTSATKFSPYAVCTRAQIVAFLYRAAGSPPVTGSNIFFDVAPNAFYRNAVIWATGRGITKGTSSTTFSPNATCTRAEVVTFLFRALVKV